MMGKLAKKPLHETLCKERQDGSLTAALILTFLFERRLQNNIASALAILIVIQIRFVAAMKM